MEASGSARGDQEVRRSPIDAVLVQPCAMQQEFHRRFRTPDAPEQRAGGDEKEG